MKLKDFYPSIVVAVIVVLIFVGLNYATQNETFGSGPNLTLLDGLTTVTDATNAIQPVKLLSKSTSREYAIITNVSGTAVYLYFPTATLVDGSTQVPSGSVSATSTITALDGVYLAASGGTYEIDASNLLYGDVWASSTAAALSINVSYK